jgi:hypothetical protein
MQVRYLRTRARGLSMGSAVAPPLGSRLFSGWWRGSHQQVIHVPVRSLTHGIRPHERAAYGAAQIIPAVR